jgi:hypothetical protein
MNEKYLATKSFQTRSNKQLKHGTETSSIKRSGLPTVSNGLISLLQLSHKGFTAGRL